MHCQPTKNVFETMQTAITNMYQTIKRGKQTYKKPTQNLYKLTKFHNKAKFSFLGGCVVTSEGCGGTFQQKDLWCVSVIRKAQVSPRVWNVLRFNAESI